VLADLLIQSQLSVSPQPKFPLVYNNIIAVCETTRAFGMLGFAE
jgi:hypothetical protein